jgi:hypothetical protein
MLEIPGGSIEVFAALDANGNLLQVGCTGRAPKRIAHAGMVRWRSRAGS